MKKPKSRFADHTRCALGGLKHRAMIQGQADAMQSALGFLDAGYPDAARAVLSGARLAWIEHLRERISTEPGGRAYVPTPSESDGGGP